MSAHSVSPPFSGTSTARSSDALAPTFLNDESVCQERLPFRNRPSLSSGLATAPSLPTLESSEISCRSVRCESVRSSGPKRRLKAMCSASLKCASGKTSTAWRWNAPSIRRHSPSPSAAQARVPNDRAQCPFARFDAHAANSSQKRDSATAGTYSNYPDCPALRKPRAVRPTPPAAAFRRSARRRSAPRRTESAATAWPNRGRSGRGGAGTAGRPTGSARGWCRPAGTAVASHVTACT